MKIQIQLLILNKPQYTEQVHLKYYRCSLIIILQLKILHTQKSSKEELHYIVTTFHDQAQSNYIFHRFYLKKEKKCYQMLNAVVSLSHLFSWMVSLKQQCSATLKGDICS